VREGIKPRLGEKRAAPTNWANEFLTGDYGGFIGVGAKAMECKSLNCSDL
jgi:hypothetical protein